MSARGKRNKNRLKRRLRKLARRRGYVRKICFHSWRKELVGVVPDET